MDVWSLFDFCCVAITIHTTSASYPSERSHENLVRYNKVELSSAKELRVATLRAQVKLSTIKEHSLHYNMHTSTTRQVPTLIKIQCLKNQLKPLQPLMPGGGGGVPDFKMLKLVPPQQKQVFHLPQLPRRQL